MALFGLVRFLDDGSVDPTFGDAGLVVAEFEEGSATAFDLAIDTQDRVVMVGAVATASGSVFAVSRHRSDGTLDRGFGTDGRVLIPFDQGRSLATAVEVDGEGRIVVVGGVDGGDGDIFAAVRLLEDGTLDRSFGSGGRVATAFEAGHGFALDVSVDPSDRIVAAGFANAGVPGSLFALVRYLEDGALDPGFGDAGRVLVEFQGADNAFAVAHDARWRIVVAGKAGPGGSSDAAVARLRGNGELDVTFGVAGKAYSDLGGSRGRAFGIALTTNDRIVLAGLAHQDLDQFGVARLLAGGDHDQMFSSDGRALSGFFDTDGAQDVAVDSANRVVAVGFTGTAAQGTVYATTRMLADGQEDPSFGLNGQVFTDFSQGSVDRASAVGIDSAARIVVGGTIGHPRGWPLGPGPHHAGERIVKGVRVPDFDDVVKGIVYYPARHEGLNAPLAFGPAFPMVGFVHANRGGSPCPGTPGDKTDDYRQLATVLRHLARWGYVVISTDASGSPPGPAYREDLLVSSLRFLIDEADRNGSPFQGKLKTTGVILAGHSTGGGAAMTNSGDPTLDVGAIVTLVPSSPQPPPDLSIPTLVIGVSEDDGTFGGNAGALYTQAGVPKHLVQITGANHFGFTEELCFGTDGQATISREDQQRVAIAYITAFLQLYIRNDVSYQQVLRGAEQIESLEPFGIDVQFET